MEGAKLEQILRPLINKNTNEGQINTVAISPDGKEIIAGGWEGCDEDMDMGCSIYVFERTTGKLKKRISRLPAQVLHLTYSSSSEGGTNLMKIFTKGFFLLELLLSLLIIAILLAVSIPIYQVYLNRVKVSEAMILMVGVKTDIVTHYSYYGKFPANANQLNIVTVGNYVEELNVDNGVITSKFDQSNEVLANLALSLVPALAKTELPKVIRWTCGYASTPDNFVSQGTNQTDIPPEYLVSICRSPN